MHIQESSSLKSIDLMLPYTQVWVIKRSLNFKPYNAHRAIGEKFKGSCVDLKFICLIWLSGTVIKMALSFTEGLWEYSIELSGEGI